ncbi:MAG TPA: hypothetical protein VF173_10965 [Thermoanaerobaculia bacterium]|nr:hypothetical protein [Thermoanaerobaculia bacterium]
MRRSLQDLLRSLRLSLDLLLGRRLVLFGVIDGVVVLLTGMSMLLSSEGAAGDLYRYVFLVPSVLLGLPAMAGMVDLERQAGCLDLALAAPSAEAYFVRRAAAVCLAMALQGELIMGLAWAASDRSFPLLAPALQIVAASALLGAVSLFWAVRLRTAGGVWLASAVTLGALGQWFFYAPIPDRLHAAFGAFLPGGEASIPWLKSLAVLVTAAVLFFLYARRRLRRPELMIS